MLLHDLLGKAALRTPDAVALATDTQVTTYGALQAVAERFAGGILDLGLDRGDRVAVFLEKRIETVAAMFGASAAGCTAVPVNPLLKADQVRHILSDCGARVLITSAARVAGMAGTLDACPALDAVALVDAGSAGREPVAGRARVVDAGMFGPLPSCAGHRVIDADMAAIFYTSGSTGRPKGVVVSHRNLVAGASSVAEYLGNHSGDVILAALPLSFDAGFSQLTTAFLAGARVVLLNYLMPQDVLRAIDTHGITGITAVPPLYIQLARLEWRAGAGASLRYFANTGGHMPREILSVLRRRWPQAAPFLMYGLTESFRSTYLPPSEVDRRPDSIGRAIPGAEVLVLRPDGSRCAPGEAGELVHRGALVSLGYWKDPQATAARFRPLPDESPGRAGGLPLPELAVYSGDTVRADEQGFLYFVGRADGMIKTSGYRVSPTEIEEVIYASGLVAECLAVGLPDAALGQAIAVALCPAGDAAFDTEALLSHCRSRLPAYMMPSRVACLQSPLPRNPNGKMDRDAVIALFGASRPDS